MNDSDALLIEIRADQKQLIADLNKANKSLDKFAADAEKGTKKAAGGFESIAGAVKRLAGPAALALVVKQMYDLTVGAMAFADHISDTSKQLGLSTDAYQELAFAMNQSGVETSEFEMSMRRLQDMLGEATAGNEAAQNAFTDIGISIAQLKGLKPEQAFNLVANALSGVADEAQRAAAAKDIFGKAGANIAVVARDGAKAFDELREKAQALGIVMGEDTVARAAELNDEFEAAKTLIGVEVKNAFVELAPVIVEVAKWIAKAAGAMNDFLAGFKEAKNLSLEQTREELREINEELEGLKNAAYVEPSLPSTERWGAEAAYEAALLRKKELETHLRANRPGRGGPAEKVNTTPEGKATFASKSDKGKKKEEVKDHLDAQAAKAAADTEYYAELRAKYMDDESARKKKYFEAQLDLTMLLEQGVISYEEYTRDTQQLDYEYLKSHVDTQAQKAAADDEYFADLREKYMDDDTARRKRYDEAQIDLVTMLEQGIISYEEYTRDKAQLDTVFLKQSQSTTETMLQQWANLADNMDDLFGDAIEGISDGFADMAMGGKMNVEDMAKSIIKNLIKIRLQAMLAGILGGKGGFLGAIGGALGLPGRAGGGHVNEGGVYEINERGKKREIFKAPSSGTMVPGYAQGNGGGGAVHVELINKGGDKKATAAKPTQTGRDMFVQVFLEDLSKGGPMAKGISNTFGTSRAAR